MEKQYAIPIVLGLSIVLLAISTSLLSLQQFASATAPALKKPANPAAGAPPGKMTRGLSDMTGGNITGGNMTRGLSDITGGNITGGNMTRGLSGIPSANPAAGAPPATPTMPNP